MDTTTKKILEIVTETQDAVSEIRKETPDMRREIGANTRAIVELTEQLRGVMGYAKEIDHLMTRVAELERRVGVSK
jgi:Mg2+ and Co2+ transporter CorA